MINLSSVEFEVFYLSLPGVKPWYYRLLGILPRAFEYENEIYINADAFILNERDKALLLAHEQGHREGKKHTLTGIMSPYGGIRYLTTSDDKL